jgi:hypothetical protein
MKRRTEDEVMTGIVQMKFAVNDLTKEHGVILIYGNGDRVVVHITAEEYKAIKQWSDFIVAHHADPMYLDMVEDKRDALQSVLRSAVRKDLILAQYDPGYFYVEE